MRFKTNEELRAFCRADRDHLLGEVGRRGGLARTPVPAEVLEEILEDVLGMCIIPRAMPDSYIGHFSFDRRVISISTRLAEVSLPNTNVLGLRHSTLAHELGHLRLEHEAVLRHHQEKDTMTLPLFGDVAEPGGIECRRDWKKKGELSPLERRLEREANIYASIFLVPENQLVRRVHGSAIRRWWQAREAIESDLLWQNVYPLAESFGVTPDLMSWRLVDLGWLARQGKKLCIAHQQALPLAEAEGA